MLGFKDYLTEITFSDLKPQKGKWETVSVKAMSDAQREKAPNINTELFDLLDKSYAYIGGHVNIRKPNDLPSDYPVWYAVDTSGDKEPDAVKFAKKTSFGIKWTGGATDGTPEAKQKYIEAHVASLRTAGNYCEVSDAIMHILITRYQIPHVDDHKFVERVLDKTVKWIGKHPQGKYPGYEGFYIRELGGTDHLKILVGKPSK